MPQFGTMADCDDLLARVHQLRMQFVIDLVVNRNSDKQGWFRQSRQDKTNPYRNYYVRLPPSDPNWEYPSLY